MKSSTCFSGRAELDWMRRSQSSPCLRSACCIDHRDIMLIPYALTGLACGVWRAMSLCGSDGALCRSTNVFHQRAVKTRRSAYRSQNLYIKLCLEALVVAPRQNLHKKANKLWRGWRSRRASKLCTRPVFQRVK